MRKAFALLFITLSSATAIAQPRPTGLVFEDTRYQATPKLGHGMSFSSDPKPAHSLKKYCPTPGNQGSLSSCVGWASGYGAYTIAYCQKNGITDQAQKDAVAFNPMYVYLNILPATSDCNVGTNLNDAMDHLLKKGDCKLKSFSTHDCRPMPGPDQDNEASTFTIKDYGRLFSSFDNAETKILGTVKSISEGKPVVIGMKVTPSFYKVGKEPWVVTDKEENLGGHAMVVIGYDNMRKVFEIMNSWGTTWGNGGFFEMSYPEYAEMVRYGVQMNIGGGKVEKEIAGNFHFKKYVSYDQATGKYNFSDITPTLNDGVYSLNVNKDDFFRIVADNMTKDCYVYVFSLKPNKSVEILYPEDKAFKSEGAGFSMSKVAQIPRVLSDNASITIPDGEEGGMTSDQAGEDYLCVLYSSKTIDDIQEMVKKVNTSSSSDFHSKLKDAFGDRLVDKNTVYYEPQLMAVKSKVGDSYIVPIVLRANVQ